MGQGLDRAVGGFSVWWREVVAAADPPQLAAQAGEGDAPLATAVGVAMTKDAPGVGVAKATGPGTDCEPASQ